jgi:hypothetical protein
MYAHMQYFLCMQAYVGFHRTTHIYIGPTFLKVSAPQKNKKKCTNEELKCNGD